MHYDAPLPTRGPGERWPPKIPETFDSGFWLEMFCAIILVYILLSMHDMCEIVYCGFCINDIDSCQSIEGKMGDFGNRMCQSILLYYILFLTAICQNEII